MIDKSLNVAFVAIIIVSLALCAINFKLYGDIFRFLLPALCVIVPFYKKDFEVFKQFIFALLLSSLAVYLIKFGIVNLVKHYDLGDIFAFAMRPINGHFSGFPSGHTAGAFISVAFGYFYFSRKWKILFLCLAIIVGVSRIYSGYHTILQVICGGGLGFLISFFTIKYLKERTL